jgi:hypothetical protein
MTTLPRRCLSCGATIPRGSRCRRCGKTTARGYGAQHQQLRAEWAPLVDAGQVACARCGQPIEPGAPWDLGHTDDRTAWTGPEHATCNRAAGGRNGKAIINWNRRSRW